MPNPTVPLTDPTIGKGPNDRIGFNGADNVITMLDAFDDQNNPIGYNVDGGSGDDTITGSGHDDTLVGGMGSDIVAGGGGSDVIHGGKESGDEGKDRGTTVNTLYGELDALVAASDVTAAGDTIFGGEGATNNIFGDYRTVDLSGAFTFTGGNDTLVGGNLTRGVGAVNNIHGDAEFVVMGAGSAFVGGNDTITGGAEADNSMFGDAFQVTFTGVASFTGGNDTIRGGDGIASTNDLYGDAQTVNFNGHAATFNNGDDTLISGAATNDVMRGDAVQFLDDANAIINGGNDTFVFEAGNGRDTIVDFHIGEDIVLLQGIAGFSTFADVQNAFTATIVSAFLALDLDGTVDGLGDLVIFDGIAVADSVNFSAAEFAFA